MKHILFTLLGLFILSTSINAQDTPKKMLKNARKAFGLYNLDPQANKDKLQEAKIAIEEVVETDELKSSFNAWHTYGEIYNEIANAETIKLISPDYELSEDSHAAYKAFQGLLKAKDLAEKKFETRDALNALKVSAGAMNSIGFAFYQRGQFKGAYDNFNGVVDVCDLLEENKQETVFSAVEDFNDQIFVSAVCAQQAGMNEKAEALYMRLLERGVEKPEIYEGLFNVNLADNPEKAQGYLVTGREKYPENVGLLFADINKDLQSGNLEGVQGKLMMALEKDPENPTVHLTLGNVYDQIYQKYDAEGDVENAKVFFDKAKERYGSSLELKPDYFDALYSLGAIEYNRAVGLTEELNILADDYSREGTRKYNAKKAEIDEVLEVSLPYFKKCEAINPNDRNTVIALKELFARKDDLEVSNIFKERLEKIENGELITESYFK